jgi:hypothetical protein
MGARVKRPAWEDYGYSGGGGFAPPSTAPTVQMPQKSVQPAEYEGPTVVNPTVPPSEPKLQFPQVALRPPLGSRSGGPQGHLQFPMKGARPGFSTQNIPRNGQQGV